MPWPAPCDDNGGGGRTSNEGSDSSHAMLMANVGAIPVVAADADVADAIAANRPAAALELELAAGVSDRAPEAEVAAAEDEWRGWFEVP
jgi:hypothetical protein